MILGISIATALAWLLAAAFFGAGVFNLFGSAAVRAGFVRWGYPAWWNFVTGGLEILAALFIVMPQVRLAGLGLAALICVAAVGTVLRHRDYGHLPPGIALTILAALDLILATH